jgi:hypothetical protein
MNVCMPLRTTGQTVAYLYPAVSTAVVSPLQIQNEQTTFSPAAT